MSEAAVVAIVMAAINTIGSCILSFLRYYYRAHYGITDFNLQGGNNNRKV